MVRLSAVLLLGVLLAPAVHFAQEKGAKDNPTTISPAGNWKFYLPFRREGGDQPSWLLQFGEKDGKWTGSVLATGKGWPKGKVEKVAVKTGVLKFELQTAEINFPCEFKLPKEEKKRLTGAARIQKRDVGIELERTKVTSLEQFDLLREELEKEQPGRRALQLAMTLLQEAEDRKINAKDVRKWAQLVSDSAALYSPKLQRDMIRVVADILSEQKSHVKLALEYARKADKMLDPNEAPAVQKPILETLASVLEKAGQADEAKQAQARLAKLDFSIKVKKFAGRKGKSSRAVLVELFTGAQCPPCVAADLAFDALGKTYRPSEVILLQYHLHVPRPDPLTGPDSEARAGFYEEQVRGTPAVMINGKPGPSGGGGRDDAQDKYDEYVNAVEPLLEAPAKAALTLSAARKGDTIDITAEVKDLAEKGEDVRLRVVLIEEKVNYKGANGLAVHHHVVRTMPGGSAGTQLKEKAAKKTFKVDLKELRKTLTDYLEKQNKKDPFPGKERPLELKKFRVVAFVQNDKTAEVLQAAQAEVTAADKE